MNDTIQTLEFQIAQEYTGQRIDLCFLPSMWREVLDEGIKTAHIAAVTNTGRDYNWTGSYLAAANLYGYGRLAWDASLSPEAIADEWCSLMFDDGDARRVIKGMLLRSRGIYESYTTPMGMGWFVSPRGHYGPDPLGYEFSKWGTYHRADRSAVGIDRTSAGSGFTLQYPPEKAQLYDKIETCPEELLLFFHRVAYRHRLRNGKTLLQHLYDCHFKGAEAASALLAEFETLKGKVPEEIFANVLQRLRAQQLNAYEWRDVFNTFFYRLTGEGDEQGRVIHK
jgi:alpha-glucuronidase